MNYLAHAFLSFSDPAILTGNLISDHVKGKKISDYEEKVLAGIYLHRAIDDFTDRHSCTKSIRSFFSSSYGLYSAVFADIVYDYFLANDKKQFLSDLELYNFSITTYDQLGNFQNIFPLQFQKYFHSMKLHNWLYNYRTDEGIMHSFSGIVNRAKYMNDSKTAFMIFLNYKNEMRPYYEDFFPEVKNFAQSTLQQLIRVD